MRCIAELALSISIARRKPSRRARETFRRIAIATILRERSLFLPFAQNWSKTCQADRYSAKRGQNRGPTLIAHRNWLLKKLAALAWRRENDFHRAFQTPGFKPCFRSEDSLKTSERRVASSPPQHDGSEPSHAGTHKSRARGHATPRGPRGEKTRRRCVKHSPVPLSRHRTRRGSTDPARARDLAPEGTGANPSTKDTVFFLNLFPRNALGRPRARASLTNL